MSQILTRAHDELYKRTPDERFATMQDLWDSCQARKQRSELLWRSADDLLAIPRERRLELATTPIDSHRMNSWSFAQLCGIAGVNRDTVNRLTPETAAKVFEETMPKGGKPMQLYTDGDLIVLGEHRLLCGDSASAADVACLVDGQSIDLVNTDPPYNVKVEPRSNNAIAAGNSSFKASGKSQTHHQKLDLARHPGKAKGTHKQMRAKDRPLENDHITSEAFDELLLAWFGNASRVLKPGGSFYIWGGYANLGNYPGPLKACGLYFSQGIVWDKQHPVLTRKDFMGAFEICFYGWKEGAGHHFFGPNNATDLWHIKKVNPQSMVHLTEKPVELAVRAIQYSSRPGESVLDLFGGSGSTLIACEQTGRRAFLMEIDPAYCDVIVERWEKFTGKNAERIPAAANADAAETPATAAAGVGSA